MIVHTRQEPLKYMKFLFQVVCHQVSKDLAANWLQYLEGKLFAKHYSIHFSEMQKNVCTVKLGFKELFGHHKKVP